MRAHQKKENAAAVGVLKVNEAVEAGRRLEFKPDEFKVWAAGMLCRNAAEEYAGGCKTLNSNFAGGSTS